MTFIISLFLSMSCHGQKPDFTLKNKEINQLLADIDTLEESFNYHVFIIPTDDKLAQIHIWINERFGETRFTEVGINLCSYYSYKNSYVYLYKDSHCKPNIPENLLVKTSDYSYDYLNNSPFHKEGGFYQAFLIERDGESIIRSPLEIIEDDDIEKELKKLLGY